MALSQRGHGRSDRPPEGYTPRDFATDLALFMDALHLDAAVVMGHSMGATIAQRFALDYPKKTRALILIGAIASFPPNASVAGLKKAVDTLTDPVPLAFAEGFQRSTLARPVNPQFIENGGGGETLAAGKGMESCVGSIDASGVYSRITPP